jgi:hypothetical protein
LKPEEDGGEKRGNKRHYIYTWIKWQKNSGFEGFQATPIYPSGSLERRQ